MPMKYIFNALAAVFCIALAMPLAALAQESSGFGKLDTAAPSGIAPEEIIAKFGAREAEFAQARDNYTFRQTVKVDSIDSDTNKVDGEYQEVTDIVFTPEGKREEHVVFAPQSTLERVMLQQQDLDDIDRGFPFVLTTQDLPKFDIAYLGRQRVDDVDTYVFSANPKVLDLKHRNFSGKVWVDQQDFEIVLINGKIVPDDLRRGHENFSPPFTTYYEQIDGKNWFPTYTKAEGVIHMPAQQGALSEDVHMRMTVKYTDYKRFRATSRVIYNGEDITNKKEPGTPDSTPPAAPPK